MTKTGEIEAVENTLRIFFKSLDDRDNLTICQIWHPEARLFLNNAVPNIRSLPFLLHLPDAMDFRVREIKHVDVQNAIATARVDYCLAVGIHAGFFNLVKVNGSWQIANWVDHGVQDRKIGHLSR